MPSKYGKSARSSAFQWFLHRITGTFLVFLLITHFWVQHYDRTTASISHDVVTAEQAEAGVLPRYSDEANAAVLERQRALRGERVGNPVIPAQEIPAQERPLQPDPEAEEIPGPTHPPAEAGIATPYDVLMLRLADPVYAVLWKGFNILFLLFALHHGFYGLNNILTDYIRNDMVRAAAITLSWGVALVLFVIGTYSVTVAGLNL
jgi:succinate dehydrogenase / fumarate reductase membrane anchor subunit